MPEIGASAHGLHAYQVASDLSVKMYIRDLRIEVVNSFTSISDHLNEQMVSKPSWSEFWARAN